MHFFLTNQQALRIFVLTSFLLTVFTTAIQLPADPSTITPRDFSLMKSGPYQIINCGGEEPQSNAAIFATFLHDALYHIQAALLPEIELGTNSSAFRTFFKTDRAVPIVRHIFQNIANGTPVDFKPHPSHHGPQGPEFICKDPPQDAHLPDQMCDGNFKIKARPGTPFISLCPSFWENFYRNLWPAHGLCPNVDDKGAYVPSNGWMSASRYAALVRELVRLYGVGTKRGRRGWSLDEVELREGECAAMGEAEALGNAGSWGLFASCEL